MQPLRLVKPDSEEIEKDNKGMWTEGRKPGVEREGQEDRIITVLRVKGKKKHSTAGRNYTHS